MKIYEKFGKDEDLAEKERTFKNNKGDTLTITPKNENEFTLHHKSSSGKEWKEKHSRVQASNMLDRFLNKGLVEEMEDNFVNEASLHEVATHSVKLKQDIYGYKKGQRVKTILATNLPYKDNHWIHQGKWKDHAVGARLEPEDYEDVKKLNEDEQLDEVKNTYHYTIHMENGKKVKWSGKADDEKHAEGLAISHAKEKHGGQVYDSYPTKNVNEDEQLDEGVKTKYNYQGKIYNTKAFKTVKGANAFMDNNPQHGLLDIEKDEKGNEKAYHVAHIRDVGIRENSIIQNVCKRNHADAIPQFNQKIMAQVYEKMNELFVEVAGKSFNKVDEGGMFNSAKVTFSQVPHEHVPFVKKMAKKHRATVKTYQNKHGMDMEFSFKDRFPESFASHDSRNFKDSVKHLNLQHDTGMGLQFK